MEPKDTLSSCSDSDEQDMQQMLKRAKILKYSCLNGPSALKSNFTRKHVQGITKSEFERAFSHIFGEDVDIFTNTFSQNMDTLEQQLTKETIFESNCQNSFRVLKTQFEKIFISVLIKPSSLDEFRDTLIHHIESVKKSIDERAHHKREYDSRVNDRQMQTIEEKVDTSKALDASLVDTESSGTESKEQDTSRNSVNTKFAKSSILGKPPLQPIRNQPVVRQPTAYKSERSQFPRHRIAVTPRQGGNTRRNENGYHYNTMVYI
ncbi:hypothetical protein Tco_1240822 [Tanacetum coccineum]